LNAKLSLHWERIQACIFPSFKEEVGSLTRQHSRIMVVLDVLDLDKFQHLFSLGGRGRPPRDRIAIARSFVAKSVLNLATTRALLDRLHADAVLRRICGFEYNKEIPCEATFSNAFADFSKMEFLDFIHAATIKSNYKEEHGDKVVGHISRDSTDIAARGKVPKVPKHLRGKRKNRVRGKKRRVVRQLGMSFNQMLKDIPTQLDCGAKRGHRWKGFKLHLDVADGGVPISALVTSASLHDSQAAIPLEEKTSRRVTSLYTLMDSAYDAKEIKEFVARKNKVSLIEPHNRAGQKVILDPAQRERYSERTTVERAYSRLKDDFGGRSVRVKTHAKVFTHIMFGVLALTAEQLIRNFS
jgi:hypothetical protein